MKPTFNQDQLNQPITLEEKIQEPDGHGGFIESWQSVGTAWAAVIPFLPSVAAEIWQGEQAIFKSRYRLWFRAFVPLKPQMRFRWYDEVLEAIAAPVYTQGRYFKTILTCTQEVR